LRYLEDFQVGQTFELGEFTLTAEDIIAFGERYDPQSFHLSDDADGPFGGLIASGWQTGSNCQHLLVTKLLGDSASLGSPGVERIRFLKPVRPGVSYAARFKVQEVTPSKRREDRGTMLGQILLTDPKGVLVYSLDAFILFSRQGATPGGA